jgi:hypothetical protein
MKHVKLFEDFGSSNYGGNKNSSNLVITSYGKMDADKLAAKANQFGFPILKSASVADNYLRNGKIWSIENGSDLYFYQPSVDARTPITTPSNKRISLADFCMKVGCTENEILSMLEMRSESLLEPNYITKPGDIVICFGGEDGAYVRVDKQNYLNTPEFKEAAEYYQEYYGLGRGPEILREPGIKYIIQDVNNDFYSADQSELTDCFSLYDTANPSDELEGDQTSEMKLLGLNLPEPGRWFHMHINYGIAAYDNLPGKDF